MKNIKQFLLLIIPSMFACVYLIYYTYLIDIPYGSTAKKISAAIILIIIILQAFIFPFLIPMLIKKIRNRFGINELLLSCFSIIFANLILSADDIINPVHSDYFKFLFYPVLVSTIIVILFSILKYIFEKNMNRYK